jgi:hypothetical protein
MAINGPALELLLKAATKITGPKRLACLGYPDILVTEEHLKRICGPDVLEKVDFRDDAEPILRWHQLSDQMNRLVESRSLFQAMGIETDFLDIHASRGFEIIVDLNAPLPEELKEQYHLVYDGGTMEHCFNVGLTIKNILALGKTGAFILHVNPLNYFNHGFFNFCPTFYFDFYAQSGNRIVSDFYGIHGPVLYPTLFTLHPTGGVSSLPDRSVLMVMAEKLNTNEATWPLQSKYRSNPDLKS